MKIVISKLESEKHHLQEELSRRESHSSKLEIKCRSIDGDLQRLQMMLEEKDTHINVNDIILNFIRLLIFCDFRNCKANITIKDVPLLV